MEFRTNKDGKSELLIEPDERELMNNFNKDLESANLEVLDTIISQNLNNNNISKYAIYSGMASSLSIEIHKQSAAFLLPILEFSESVRPFMELLKEERLIGDKAANAMIYLSGQYGKSLKHIRLSVTEPNGINNIDTNLLMKDQTQLLHSVIWKNNGRSIEFDIPLSASIDIANHFIKRALETIRSLDKELILEIKKEKIDTIEKTILELKELKASVETEITEESGDSSNKST